VTDLSQTDWDDITDLITFLKPFKEALEDLQDILLILLCACIILDHTRAKYPTLSLAYSYVKCFHLHIQSYPRDGKSARVISYINSVSVELSNRTTNMRKLGLKATFLDPRLKDMAVT
jgi:hypothetical protein